MRFRINTAPALLLAGLVACGPLVAGTLIEPSVGLGLTYIDNLGLAPPDQPQQSDLSVQLTPRLLVSRQGARFTGILDYSRRALFFRNNPRLNSNYGSGNANGVWTVAPNALFLEGWMSNSQQVIDPNTPRNVENLFDVRNVATNLSSRLAPYFKRNFGDFTALLRYSWAWDRYGSLSTDAQNNSLQDSDTHQVTARVGSNDAGRRVTWSAGGVSSRTTFASAAPFSADRVSAEAGLLLVRGLRLIGTVGAETDLRKGFGQGGLDAHYWLAGFSYVPSERSMLEVRAGRRYFGNSYVVNGMLAGRVFKFDASYTEDPTTDGQFGTLLDVVPGVLEVPEALAVTSVLRNTYQPYLRKQYQARLRATGGRTEVALTAYGVRRKYLLGADAGLSDLNKAGQLLVTRTMTARDRLRLSVLFDSVALRDGLSNHGYYDSLVYSRDLTPTLSLDVAASHLDRSGDLRYRANFGGISFRKVFK
jgi:uncharacterized protein (PEP-CTERM system associated)